VTFFLFYVFQVHVISNQFLNSAQLLRDTGDPPPRARRLSIKIPLRFVITLRVAALASQNHTSIIMPQAQEGIIKLVLETYKNKLRLFDLITLKLREIFLRVRRIAVGQ
jgi:hypothetical protein